MNINYLIGSLVLFGLSFAELLGYETIPAHTDLSVQQIIRKNTEAMGGRREWESITSIRQSGVLHRGDLEIEYVVIRKQPNRMRMTLTLPSKDNSTPALQIIRGCDGNTAWTGTRRVGQMLTEQVPLGPEETKALLSDASMLPILMRLEHRECQFELIGLTNDGSEAPRYIIEAQPEASSSKYRLYVSTETFLVDRYEILEADTVTTTIQQQHFLQFEEIRWPETVQMYSPATGETCLKIHDTQIGVGIYNEYFEIENKEPSSIAQNASTQ